MVDVINILNNNRIYLPKQKKGSEQSKFRPKWHFNEIWLN